MVSENDEETEKPNKTDHKANTQKAKTFTQINNVIDTSCTKLQELFSCQKVAHSVIFYVIIFLLLLVLVYIFRKLVSLPNSNGRYHGRKQNASTTTTGSQNPDNASMSKGFPTKWPKPNTILKKYPDNVPISSDFSSARETKTHIYSAPENGWQKHEYSDSNNNFNSLESYKYKYKMKNPSVNSYSSSFNNNFLKDNQQDDKEQASNNLHAANWKTSNYVSNDQYGKTPSESSGTSFRSSSGYGNKKYDWFSQENSGFTQPDSSWKTSWSSEPWDLQSWPYSGSSGSGVRKINHESQGVRSKYHSFPGPTSLANDYAWGSWAKWSQPGSGFGWVKATDYNKENSYKSMTTPNWNNYNYDSTSGKWDFNNNQNTNAYSNSQFVQEHGTSNLYHADSTAISAPSSWNPYAEYWNQTQGWGDFDATNSNTALGINTRERLDRGNHPVFADNGIKSFQETSKSALRDDNVDERIHRWPLEDNREDELPKPLSSTFMSKNGKNSKGSRKKNRKLASRKISHLHKLKKIRKKKKHAKYVKKKKKGMKEHDLGNVKKSYIPHPKNSEFIKKGGSKRKKKIPRISGKHISQKLSRKRKKKFKIAHSKLKKHSTISMLHKDRKKQNHFVGKWKRKVHHVKHCKNLQSFESNGKVKLDKKYLQKQRTYKYTVLSCRYINIRNRRKIHRRHLDDDDVDDFNEDNGDEDEKPLKRKQICRKFWFITNGKIILKKTTKKHGLRSFKVLLCRRKDEPQIRNRAKIRTVSHRQHYKPSELDDDDDNIDNSRLENEKDNNDLDDEAIDQEDNGSKDRIETLSKYQAHIKVEGYPTDDTYNEDDDSENDFQTTKPKIENIKKNHDNDEDNDTFEGETLSDIDDDIDIDTNSKHISTSKHIVENDDEKMGENKQKNSDENGNDFFAESSTKKPPSHRKIEKSKYNNRHMKISRPDKTKQNDNKDDLNQEDIDDIDDVDDNINSRYPEGNDERQRPIDDVTAGNDDELDSNRFDGDLDDIDIMDTDHTTSLPKSTISSRLQKAKKGKNKHQSIKHKSSDTKQGSDKRSNVYERLLHELTKDKDIKNKGNDPKRLLASILKQKIDSVRAPKHASIEISRTKSPHLEESKQKDKVQTDNEIRPSLKKMLINSLGLNSLSQVINAKQPNKITTTPRPNRKQFMKDILKEFSDQTLQTWSKTKGFTTLKPTVAPTSDEQMKIQFAKLLKKFGIQINAPPKTFAAKGSSTTRKKNLPNDIGNKIQMNNVASTVSSGPDVMSNKLSLPTPDLSPLPSPPPLKPLPPPRLATPEQLSQQRQKQPTQSQLLSSPLSLQSPKRVSTSLTNVPYLNQERDQKQFNVQRSFIPTIKPQETDQISQAASFPQSQQQIKNPRYSYSSYSSNNNNPFASSQTQQTINVLCFGDSLTSGFYNHGRGKHPYSIKLNQLLNPQENHRYHIETRGVVGEMVHGSMTKRLPKILNEGTHYDWVLILGGTNDVAHVKNFGDDQDFTRQLISVWSPKIVKDIEKLHETAHSYGSRTVLMTIPETAYELWPDFISIRNMRLSVNAALRKYATEVRDTTVLCDLAYKLPRSTLSHEMEKLYWNDHIHLNPVGYNKMAEVIQQCIQPYLS